MGSEYYTNEELKLYHKELKQSLKVFTKGFDFDFEIDNESFMWNRESGPHFIINFCLSKQNNNNYLELITLINKARPRTTNEVSLYYSNELSDYIFKTKVCISDPSLFLDYCVYMEFNFLTIKNIFPVDYKKYILSSEFRKLRNKILNERGYNCERCSSSKNLQLHHLTYQRLGLELENDLIILCQKCHKEIHHI